MASLNKELAIIFDIDGTLADCSARPVHMEGKKNYLDKLYAGISEDLPIDATVMVLQLLIEKLSYRILFVSGRPERYRDQTVLWMKNNLKISPWDEFLFMRPNGDFSSDNELKKRIYLSEIEPKYKVELVFDDCNKVVEMWRSLGLTCWQVAEGNF